MHTYIQILSNNNLLTFLVVTLVLGLLVVVGEDSFIEMYIDSVSVCDEYMTSPNILQTTNIILKQVLYLVNI